MMWHRRGQTFSGSEQGQVPWEDSRKGAGTRFVQKVGRALIQKDLVAISADWAARQGNQAKKEAIVAHDGARLDGDDDTMDRRARTISRVRMCKWRRRQLVAWSSMRRRIEWRHDHETSSSFPPKAAAEPHVEGHRARPLPPRRPPFVLLLHHLRKPSTPRVPLHALAHPTHRELQVPTKQRTHGASIDAQRGLAHPPWMPGIPPSSAACCRCVPEAARSTVSVQSQCLWPWGRREMRDAYPTFLYSGLLDSTISQPHLHPFRQSAPSVAPGCT